MLSAFPLVSKTFILPFTRFEKRQVAASTMPPHHGPSIYFVSLCNC